MAGQKFLRLNNGVPTETEATQTGGAGNENKIPALDPTGRIPESMLPVGIGADTAEIDASETLSAGDYVNVWNDGGTPKVRKADATAAGKEAHGFVLDAVTSGNPATVYFEGTNTQVSGQTAGPVYLSTTAGAGSSTPPSGAGNVVQRVGFAYSATNVNFEAGQHYVLA